ncbi:Y4yA family PLP-dependent enzyme [Planctomycetes bacterium K23_9]
MRDLLDDGALHQLVETHGSPLNVVSTGPMARNIDELMEVASARSLDLQIFFARKSNKCLSFIQQAFDRGIGVDTASENEVIQSLEIGMPAERVICTAAVKSAALIDRCIRENVLVVVDNHDELQVICERAIAAGKTASIAIRLGGFLHEGQKLVTRFGFDVDRDADLAIQLGDLLVKVEGVHFHLDGYDASQRITAIRDSIAWLDRLRANGHQPSFLDMGGGFPMSYLDDAQQWNEFWAELRQAILGKRDPITYRNHSLGLTTVNGEVHGSPNSYPYFQEPSRAPWFASILDASCDAGNTVAEALSSRGLQLRCEPGRSLMDGCGMTVAQVEFRKQNAEGDWLIGLSMNRTQCRTSSDDFLVDPILVSKDNDPKAAMTGFLVGAYCTESELLSLRRLHFPNGIQRGDLVVFPNTAGYLMHFLESRSHQLPLARNVVFESREIALQLDPIDR